MTRGAACLIVLALIVAGCLPAPKTTQAETVSTLWSQFVIAAAVVAAIVWGLITLAILRYRRRGGRPPSMPPQIGAVIWLEIVWTVIPVLTILVLFALTLGALGRIDTLAASRVTVDVTAFRWQWRFDYAGTPVSIVGGADAPAEMVVPVGEPIHIVLNSVDVDHSFYVPAFLFKRDAIPGRPNEFDLTIKDPGSYSGQCAEFCGVFHDRMTLTVRAVSRPEFDAWLAQEQSANPPSAATPSNSPAPAPTTSNAAAPSALQAASSQP